MNNLGTWIVNLNNNTIECPHCNAIWEINNKMIYCPTCGGYNGDKGNISCSECWTESHPCGYINVHGYCTGFVTKEEGVKRMYKFAISQAERKDTDEDFLIAWRERAIEIKTAAEKEGILLE